MSTNDVHWGRRWSINSDIIIVIFTVIKRASLKQISIKISALPFRLMASIMNEIRKINKMIANKMSRTEKKNAKKGSLEFR